MELRGFPGSVFVVVKDSGIGIELRPHACNLLSNFFGSKL